MFYKQISLLCILFSLGSGICHADTIRVPQDYPTIQQAINASSNGDEIIVSPGTYVETINFIDKDIVVRSTDPDNRSIVESTIIDGDASGTVVTLSQGVIAGFAIQNGLAQVAGGISAIGSAEIRNNIVSANDAFYAIDADGDTIIMRNIITRNEATGVFAGSRVIVDSNTISNNATYGIHAENLVSIINNKIVGNGRVGMRIFDEVKVRSNLIAGNRTTRNGGGVFAEDYNGEITTNTLLGNMGDDDGSGIYIDGGTISSNIIAYSPSRSEVIFAANVNAIIDYNCIFGNKGPGYAGNAPLGPNNIFTDPMLEFSAAGALTSSPQFDSASFRTTLTDASANYEFDEFLGSILQPDSDRNDYFAVVENSETTITVLGDARFAGVGDQYQILDIHLQPSSPCIGAGDPTHGIDFYRGIDIDGEPRVQDCLPDIGADEVAGEPTTVLVIDSTVTTSDVDVSVPDCNGDSDGRSDFNRFYTSAPIVTLAAEQFEDIPFRWIIDGVELPEGQYSVDVDLTNHVEAIAEYSPVVNITRGTAFTKIQDAIGHSSTMDGDEIVVAPSVYVEVIDFLDKAITLRSVDPFRPSIVASTIIDANREDSAVTISAGEISGLTIRNGGILDRAGGVRASGTAIVTHCIIEECFAWYGGAGVYAGGTSLILDNIIRNNWGSQEGTGLHLYQDAVAIGNTITGNTGTTNSSSAGGGAVIRDRGVFIENVVSENQADAGGGIVAYDDSIVTANVITNNLASNRAGGLYARGAGRISNNFVAWNVCEDNENGGGGIYAYNTGVIQDNAIIENISLGPGGGLHLGFGADAIGNTIIGNSAAGRGGGIFLRSRHEEFFLRNNIVAFNTGTFGIYSEEPVSIDYNCVFGNDSGGYGGFAAPGAHDINVDPLLASDLIHLLEGSPCMNTGDPNFVGNEGQTDIDGELRVMGGRVEIGADEIPAPREAAELLSFQIETGSHLGGALADLVESDDRYIHARSGYGETVFDVHHMQMLVSARTNISQPRRLSILLESHVDQQSGIAELFLRNWNTNQFDRVGSFPVRNTDEIQAIDNIDAENYVRLTGAIEIAIKHIVFSPYFSFRFVSSIDLVEITVE